MHPAERVVGGGSATLQERGAENDGSATLQEGPEKHSDPTALAAAPKQTNPQGAGGMRVVKR